MLWSDNEAQNDLLRFRYIADAAVDVIRSQHLRPTTVGIFGDWGSGKSTLIQMVDKQLAPDRSVLRVNFNGWLFEGYHDAKTALMGTILDAIQERNKADEGILKKTMGRLEALRKRVNWLYVASLGGRIGLLHAVAGTHGTTAAIGGAVLEQIVKAFQEKDKDKQLTVDDLQKIVAAAPAHQDELRRSIREFRSDFGALLAESKIDILVVFIDDLDRCLPSTVIETLEAIRLFLYVPGTVFLLGADERLVEYAVRQRFPELPGSRADVGRDYLEKLVQIPIRIPPLSGAELHAYVNLLFAQDRLGAEDFAKVCAHVDAFVPTNINDLSFGVTVARIILAECQELPRLEEDLDFVRGIIDVLAPGMQGNPRRTKRFLNMLLLRLSLGKARGLTLQRAVLAKLMLLEYMRPEFFKQLAGLQASQHGRPDELGSLEDAVRPQPEPAAAGDNSAAPAALQTTPPAEPSSSIPADVQPWMADEWVHGWLAMEPCLSNLDLRPYFYVAHDKLGALDSGQARLSAAATDVLNRLLDPQPVTHSLGLSNAKDLNAAEVTGVFDALAQRIRQAQSLDANPIQKTAFEFASVRPEVVPQLITLYGSLPVTKVTMATPGLLYEAAKRGTAVAAAQALLTRWSTSTQKAPLATAAAQALKRSWKAS